MDAPSNIKAAEDKLGIAKTSAVEPNKAYNDYNKVATMLPAEGVGKSCDILRAETSTDVEKSIVGSSPTKEECDTLYTKTKTSVEAETKAKETVETKSLEEKTIRKQLETQTSLFLSAQTSGTGGDGNDPSTTARMKVVVGAVERITAAAFNDQSEIIFSCLQDLSASKGTKEPSYLTMCRALVATKFVKNLEKELKENELIAASGNYKETSGKYLDTRDLIKLILQEGSSTRKRSQTYNLLQDSVNRQDEVAHNNGSIDYEVDQKFVALLNGSQTCKASKRWLKSNSDLSIYFTNGLHIDTTKLSELRNSDWWAGDEFQRIYDLCK